ncbi:MAG: hypothetical protein BWY14_01320 [Parcubacteria group bacterium ADurb.Bin192]|nr:MAG: hypothetical protein BWY14_01320 [Parcubacteria group bacterium ADurb.Bin192]
MDIIAEKDYLPDVHTEYSVRVAQVRLLTTVFSQRALPTVQWIFYCKEMPSWVLPSDMYLVDVTDHPDIREGWLLNPKSNTFVDRELHYRDIFEDSELMQYVRVERGRRLSNSDPLVLRHLSQPEGAKTLTDAEYAELQGYMQALRDFPANVDLDNIVWPPKPAFMA